MKKPASNRKKLTLKRQTLRTLSGDDLNRVAGGNEVLLTELCTAFTCTSEVPPK